MHKCEGCGTTDVHADDCPALDAPGSELPCLDVTPHAKHPYPFGTSYRECPGHPRKEPVS